MKMPRRIFLEKGGEFVLGAAATSLSPSKLIGSDRSITLAAVGDCLITRKFDHEGAQLAPIIQLLRGADASFGNLEMTLPDPGMHPAPTGACGDLNNSAEGPIAEEMKWAGFNLMSVANNHALDYGAEGMFATAYKLDRMGIARAGTGNNLVEASAPAYHDSRNGRTALLACASTIRPWSLAADGNDEIPGRPGLNPLRVRTTYRIEPTQLDTLKEISRSLFPRPPQPLISRPETEGFNFLGNRFVPGNPADILTEPDDRDLKRITAAVRRAARNADLVVVSIHAHESYRDREVPAKFLPIFARACVDAGADAFIGHGPHVLRGIAIYKRRPIFYSLGNFIFAAESMRQIPQEIYDACGLTSNDPSDFFDRAMKGFADAVFWESVVVEASFRNRELSELKLHPITLQPELSRAMRGMPRLAGPEQGKAIIERVAHLSEPLGTRVSFRGGVGIVEL